MADDFIAAPSDPDFIPADEEEFKELPPGVPKPQVNMETSAVGHLAPVAEGAQHVLEGIGEGALSTTGHIGKLMTDPFVSPESARRSDVNLKKLTTPQTTGEAVGKFGEQAAEMLTPTGMEGAAAKVLPKFRYAPAVSRLVGNTLETGLKNKAQGGEFGTGAAMGAGGEVLGMGLQKIAPAMAETALGVGNRLRGHGRDIGKAVLEETSKNAPTKLARQTGSRLSSLTSELEAGTHAATQAGKTIDVSTAHKALDDAIAKTPRNARGLRDHVNSLRSLLDLDGSGRKVVTPDEALELKRGIGAEIKTWEPQMRRSIEPIKRQLYGAIDKQLDLAVPGSEKLNQTISSLIPARQRAEQITRNAGFGQRVSHRIAAHTGALAGAAAGGYGGYQRWGPEGAIVGGLGGLVAPEVLASPRGRMAMSRMTYAPVTSRFMTRVPLSAWRSIKEQ